MSHPRVKKITRRALERPKNILTSKLRCNHHIEEYSFLPMIVIRHIQKEYAIGIHAFLFADLPDISL